MTMPFLKWAGGKRWLTSQGHLPDNLVFDRFVDPFIGGGALFFATRPQKALLSDANYHLIELYKTIRDDTEPFLEEMKFHKRAHCKHHYYLWRSINPEDGIKRAARFLYLNRTCWNGLYRVNKRGEFNVPKGTKNSVLYPGEDFHEYAGILKAAQIECCDFDETINKTTSSDFLFVDPPYVLPHNAGTFIKYNSDVFTWQDQIRLAVSLRSAADRGVKIIATNIYHESVLSLYEEKFTLRVLKRESIISGSNKSRGPMSEAMFVANI